MSDEIVIAHFATHEDVQERLAKYANRALYIQALNDLYPATRELLLDRMRELELEQKPLEEAGPTLLAEIRMEVLSHAAKAGHVDIFLFVLMGSELLWRASDNKELPYWTISSHLNALGELAALSSETYGTSKGDGDLHSLLKAYSFAERYSFLKHNLQVAEASRELPALSELLQSAFEPDDFEQHWENIANYEQAYVNYEAVSQFGEVIEAEMERRRDAPMKNLSLLLMETLGFELSEIGLLVQFFSDAKKRDALVFPVTEAFLQDATTGGALLSTVEQFTWSPGLDASPWKVEFRPFVGLRVGDGRSFFTAPSVANAALTSFFNVLSQNAFLGAYLPASSVEGSLVRMPQCKRTQALS